MKSFNVAVVGLAVAVVCWRGLRSGHGQVLADSAARLGRTEGSQGQGKLQHRAKHRSAVIKAIVSRRRWRTGRSRVGIKDALSGTGRCSTDEQLQQVMQEFQQQMVSKKMESDRVAADKNKKESDAFLAANKAKPGVVSLPSGLQYKVIKDGTGATPKATDTVTTHYSGTLIDGTEFDSSYKRNEPASFPVNGVIRGWTEALQKMKVGSKWQLVIPAELAYGQNHSPGSPITLQASSCLYRHRTSRRRRCPPALILSPCSLNNLLRPGPTFRRAFSLVPAGLSNESSVIENLRTSQSACDRAKHTG